MADGELSRLAREAIALCPLSRVPVVTPQPYKVEFGVKLAAPVTEESARQHGSPVGRKGEADGQRGMRRACGSQEE